MNTEKKVDDEVIAQMTHLVLSDILDQVLRDFEKGTGTRIGKIQINERHPMTDRRTVEIDIQYAGSRCLNGLMKYKQILCENESFSKSGFCRLPAMDPGAPIDASDDETDEDGRHESDETDEDER